MTRSGKRLPLVAAVVMALVLAGCGSSGSGDARAATSASTYDCSKPNADSKTEVKVATLPILSNGAVYEAIQDGTFAKHGLNVTTQTMPTLPASVSAVQGGSVDFAFSGTFQFFLAAQSGVKMRIVAPFAGIAPGYYDKMRQGVPGYTTEVTALLTKAGSGLDDPGQLNGRTVAINDARGQAELTTRLVIKGHGGEPNTVRFVQMGSDDAYNALLAGKVDAAYAGVPTFQNYRTEGAQIISWVGVEALHEGPTSAMIAADSYITDHPDTAVRFNCAMREATAFANHHPGRIRQVTAEMQKIDPATLATAVVPYFYSTIDVQGLERFQQLAVDAGFLNQKVDVATLTIPQALTSAGS